MRDGMVRALGLALAAGYVAAIVWVYTRQPQTVADQGPDEDQRRSRDDAEQALQPILTEDVVVQILR